MDPAPRVVAPAHRVARARSLLLVVAEGRFELPTKGL